jgi:hypothetical protein
MHCWLLLLLLTSYAVAQGAPGCDSVCAAKIAEAQFGPGFNVVAAYGLMTGDFDGDAAEDALLVAQSKTPLVGQGEYNYKAIDPYHTYFGYGNPNITAQFAAHDAERARVLLIIHSWKATRPKAKFLILNLPFERLWLARSKVKKKLITTIQAEESVGVVSAVYWDGKKYKWQPQ